MTNPIRNTTHFLKSQKWLHILPALITILALGGVSLGYLLVPQIREFVNEAWQVLTSENRTRIERWVSEFGIWGIAILLFFFLVQMFAFVLPSWFLIIVSVLAYGPVLGGIIALVGIALAATVAFLIGRLFSEITVHKMIGKRNERKMRFYLDKYGFWIVVIFRLAPFLSNDVISFVAGLATMKYWHFMVATSIGITPLITLIAFLGETNERLRYGFIIASVISIIGFAIYVWWDRKQQEKMSGHMAS